MAENRFFRSHLLLVVQTPRLITKPQNRRAHATSLGPEDRTESTSNVWLFWRYRYEKFPTHEIPLHMKRTTMSQKTTYSVIKRKRNSLWKGESKKHPQEIRKYMQRLASRCKLEKIVFPLVCYFLNQCWQILRLMRCFSISWVTRNDKPLTTPYTNVEKTSTRKSHMQRLRSRCMLEKLGAHWIRKYCI